MTEHADSPAVAACCVALLLCALGAGAGPATVEATHKEIESIGVAGKGRIARLASLCTTHDDKLLACDAGAKQIKVFDLTGKLRAAWPLPFAPYAICAHADGTVYVGGAAKLARLDKAGRVVKTADVNQQLTTGSPTGGPGGRFGRPSGRRAIGKASGIAATEKDLFVSFGSGWSLRAKAVIVRFGRDLEAAKKIAEGMHGCCQRLDLATADGALYVAENSRYRVVKMDRDGKVLATWGKRDRRDLEGFGSCCNPMNLCFGPGGALYTAESGLGRIKRYTPDGKFLSLVGEVGVTRFTRAGGLAASCSNIAVAVSKDGRRVFIQDVKTNGIRVLVKTTGGR